MTIPVGRAQLRKIVQQEVSAERRRTRRKQRVLIFLLFVLAVLCGGLVTAIARGDEYESDTYLPTGQAGLPTGQAGSNPAPANLPAGRQVYFLSFIGTTSSKDGDTWGRSHLHLPAGRQACPAVLLFGSPYPGAGNHNNER